MFPEDESLPPNNPEMLFMAVLLIGCPAGFLSGAAGGGRPPWLSINHQGLYPLHTEWEFCLRVDSSATPSFPSQPEGKIGLPRANPRGRLRSPS